MLGSCVVEEADGCCINDNVSWSRSQSYSESLDELKLFRINPAVEKEAKHARKLAGIEAAGGIHDPEYS